MQESETAMKNFYTALKSINYELSEESSEYSESFRDVKQELLRQWMMISILRKLCLLCLT